MLALLRWSVCSIAVAGVLAYFAPPPTALMPAGWADVQGFFAKDADISPVVIEAVTARGETGRGPSAGLPT
jgi:hypothetical protein